jgi:hypothetical protein
MTRFAFGTLFLASASAVSAQSTDFGIRSVSGERAIVQVSEHPKAAGRESASTIRPLASEPVSSAATWTPIGGGSRSLSAAARIGSQWGRVTSTWRSVAHNRRVGGVRNSFHLHGRAIDIARRPGVSHSMIAAAFRNAGYHLVESLDEGDHSHFAFSFAGRGAPSVASRKGEKDQGTNWGIVTVSSAILRP